MTTHTDDTIVRLRVLIDLDDTVANWGKRYNEGLKKFGMDHSSIPLFENLVSYDLFGGRTDQEKLVIHMIMDEPGFYSQLEPIDGAVEAVESMIQDEEWDVWFVSTPWPSNPTCASDKLNWVAEHFGKDMAKKVILTYDKTMIDGDILIDDKPVIKGARTPTWKHILFAQPHNLVERAKRKDRGILNWTDGEFWGEIDGVMTSIMFEQEAASMKKFMGGETRSVSSSGGEKGVKPQNHALVPVYPLGLLAELYDFGAQKYADHNWRKGYEWSKSYSAAQRHLQAFWGGEDLDTESGLPHVTSAAFHMFALAQFMKDNPEFDDRYKEPENEPEEDIDWSFDNDDY